MIDREFFHDRARKAQNRASKVLVLAVMLVAVLMLSAVAGLMVLIGNDGGQHPFETPIGIPARTLYTGHGPIIINGNGDFTAANGVVSGSGTSADPYIIEGWEIDTDYEWQVRGIYIWGTDACFIIRACHVTHVGSPYNAVELDSCANGILDGNNISENWHSGLMLLNSSGIDIVNNVFWDNHIGIYLAYSYSVYGYDTLVNNTIGGGYAGLSLGGTGNTIVDNTFLNQVDTGVYGPTFHTAISNNSFISSYVRLESAENNTILSNSFTDGGIVLQGWSNNNTVCNNYYTNGSFLIRVSSSRDNTICNNNCSVGTSGTLGGIELQYWANNNTVSDNYCWNCSVGISVVDYCCDNTITHNTCSYNSLGVLILHSDNNAISSNSLLWNTGYGLNVDDSSYNRIWNNVFYRNNNSTDSYDPNHVQGFDSNVLNWWDSGTGYGNWWSDWTVPDDDANGIVDVPYDLAGGSGAKDKYPLTTATEPIPEFGAMPIVVMVLLAAIVLTTGARRRRAS
jgi:parallel beta-helix repeat protein